VLTAIIIALFAGAIFLDYIPGWQHRRKKDNLVYGMLLALSFGILFLFTVGITVPSPSNAIYNIVKMIIPIG